jgi:hypothetical protein
MSSFTFNVKGLDGRQRPTHDQWTNADCFILIFPPFPSLVVGRLMSSFSIDVRFRSTSLFPFDVLVCRETNADCCITSPPSLFVVDVVVVIVRCHRCSSSSLFVVAIRRRRCSSSSLFVVVVVRRRRCSSSFAISRRLSGCVESQEREQNKDVVVACGGGVDVGCQ